MDEKYLLKKWLSNDLSIEEQKEFLLLKDASFFSEIIEEGQRFKNQNPSRVGHIKDLHLTFQASSKHHPNWSQLILKIAAVLVVSFGIFLWLGQGKTNTFETTFAQTEEVLLPDSSVVRLNELSELNFKADWGNERSVSLEGEAFFKVAKGKRFDVITSSGTVSVLGTEFNVIARDSEFSVVCYEGLVQVTHNNNTNQVPAGKAYQFIDGQAALLDVFVVQPEWLQNMKVFKDSKISDVFDAIANHYNVEIRIEIANKSMLFTGAFELNNLENALKAVTKTLNLSYVLSGDNHIIVMDEK